MTNEQASPVTRWFKWIDNDEGGDWVFNHTEFGHATTERPVPRFPTQQSWNSGKWRHDHCWRSEDGKVTS